MVEKKTAIAAIRIVGPAKTLEVLEKAVNDALLEMENVFVVSVQVTYGISPSLFAVILYKETQ